MGDRIFISYSWKDRAIADEVDEVLKRSGLATWYDRYEIRPGDSFVLKMSEGLSQCGYLLLLVSEASMASRWVNTEWAAALARQEIVLVPLILDRAAVPPLLEDRVHIDLSQDRKKGLVDLVAFFQRELEAPVSSEHHEIKRGDGSTPTDLIAALESKPARILRMVTQRCMDNLAFLEALTDFEIDFGRISGASLHERVVFLIHFVKSEGLTAHLIRWLCYDQKRCVEAQLKELRNDPFFDGFA
jgi:hypothetical protein